MDNDSAALRYQQEALLRVSRTFALTIPQLPDGLREAVANAYLLCRVADTIEDDPGLDTTAKAGFMDEFIAVVCGGGNAGDFSRRLSSALSPAMSAAEHDLVRHTPTVLGITSRLPAPVADAVARCVAVMGRGMPEFQRQVSLDGLATLQDLHRYCYYVAGSVGEMLTELFCLYCPALTEQRSTMMNLSVRFGQGLQMTNILKDVWEDRASNICWLPRPAFSQIPGGLGEAMRRGDPEALFPGITVLIGVAHDHLRAALRYTTMIPRQEIGMRRFCLWAIGMAVLTLRRIHQHPGYASARQVRISRRTVRLTTLACNAASRSNGLLRLLFRAAASGLPLGTDADAEPDTGIVPRT